jgi:hypothetical protein
VVDQGRRVDDEVDLVGQPLPCLPVQAQVRFGLVAGDDLQVLGGQLTVVRQQFLISAVEGVVEAASRILVGPGPH